MLTAEEIWRARINAIFGLPEEDRMRAFLELALAFLNAHGDKSADPNILLAFCELVRSTATTPPPVKH